jgi:hypothetical protein
MKVGDDVKVYPIHNEDCEVCIEEGGQCWGKRGIIVHMGSFGKKPIEVIVDGKHECSYEESELEYEARI